MLSKFTKSTLLTIAFILILLFAACAPMRRESRGQQPVPVKAEIVLFMDQALNLSLAYGDYRQVNVNWEETV